MFIQLMTYAKVRAENLTNNSAVPQRMIFETQPISCIDYFSNPKILLNVSSGANWQSLHFDMNNFCLYCNHSTSNEFISLLSNSSALPFFWRREQAVCNRSPAILTNMYTPYFDRLLATRDLKLRPQDNLADFINVTQIRTTTNDHVGESDRKDSFYICMFLESKMYAYVDDIYEQSIVPFRYQGVWIIDLVLRALVISFYVLVLWIPRIHHWIQNKYKKMTTIDKKQMVLEALSALQAQAMIADTLSAAIWTFEDFTFLHTTPVGFRNLAGGFRIAAMVLLSLSTFLIFVSWAYIVHVYNHMDTSEVLPKKFLALLSGVYLFHICFALVGAIVFTTSPVSARYTVISVLVLIAVFLIISFMLAISAYGVRILWLLRKNRSTTELLKLKVTRLILVSNFLWLFVLTCLIIMVVSFLAPQKLNFFFVVFNMTITDISGYIIFVMHAIMYYRHDQFKSCYCGWIKKKDPASPEPILERSSTLSESSISPVSEKSATDA